MMHRLFVLRSDVQAKSLWAFLRQNWAALAAQGKPLAVMVSEYKAKRSGEQNKRYWAILNFIAESAFVNGKRFSAEAWHEHFKRKFIGLEELPNGGSVGISTTTLEVPEFNDYMRSVESYAITELGLEMP